jgi:autotransporter-associated beta strand protein
VLDGKGEGIIEGAISPGKFGSVHKRGTGTWTLSSVNSSYHYPTVVEEGKLVANGSLPSSAEVKQGATLEASDLTIKRHFCCEGTLRCIVTNPMAGDGAPIRVWGTATLGGSLAICGKAPGEFVVLTAENGVTGEFAEIPSNFRVKYFKDEVVACPVNAMMFIVH